MIFSKYIDNIKKQTGAALVVSLLILSLTIISATALSKVILDELRITINNTNSITAFYSANTAIERGLYYLKYSQDRDNIWFLGSLENESFDITYTNFDTSYLYNDISTSTTGFSFYQVTTSSPAHIDIIDPVGNLPPSINWDPDLVGTHYYEVDWSIAECFPYHASDRLEISTYYFDGSLDVKVETDLAICNCTYNSNNACDTEQKTIYDNKFYRFAFRPIDSLAESIDFNVWADPTVGSDYLSNSVSGIIITAEGDYKDIRYKLSVETKPRSPLADIFSYVVFSEEVLEK